MAIRPVVVWPDARLTQPSVAITEVTDDVRALYRDLADTMFAENGLGIAALQIGDARRMFLVEPKLAGRGEDDPPVAFLNPEILEVSDETQDSEEGCLSFPEVYIKVERPLRARVRAMDLDGKTFEFEGEGLLARCLLHEHDHLTGKLLVDFVGPLKKQMIKKKLQKTKAAREADAEDEAAVGGMRAPRLR
ncbi:MAG: peptide deformylase [Kofleriaceae bacterium]